MKELVPRATKVPGPRLRITLNVAESSLPDLLAGVEPERCWLEDEGDGTYGFYATQTLGVSRKQAGKPSIDILIELLNAFGDELDASDVPERLRDRWGQLIDEYMARTGPINPPRAKVDE